MASKSNIYFSGQLIYTYLPGEVYINWPEKYILIEKLFFQWMISFSQTVQELNDLFPFL